MSFIRDIVPIENRFIDIVHIDVTRPRITINPCNGRVTIKVSKDMPGDIVVVTLQLGYKVRNCDEFEPFTYRGRVWYNKREGKYKIQMSTESKKHSVIFTQT